jgi:hypothetical protein
VDFSKFKTSDWLMIGGGGAMFVAAFLPWVTVSAGRFSSSGNAFEFLFTGTLPWLMLVAVAVIAALLVLEKMPPGGTPWPIILLGLAAFATVLVLIRLVFNPLEGSSEAFGIDVGRGIGMFLGVIGAIAATVGAVQNFQASGGNLHDLKDISKIKESFGGGAAADGTNGGDMPPPPPPAAGDGTPPPPPPAQ